MVRPAKDYIGTTEAGKILKMSGRQVMNLIKGGILPAEKIGRTYIIRPADLAKVPQDRKPGPKPKAKI